MEEAIAVKDITRVYILETMKGGVGSGHFGHIGRPGKRGGSLPGAGGARGFPGGITQEDIDAFINGYNYDKYRRELSPDFFSTPPEKNKFVHDVASWANWKLRDDKIPYQMSRDKFEKVVSLVNDMARERKEKIFERYGLPRNIDEFVDDLGLRDDILGEKMTNENFAEIRARVQEKYKDLFSDYEKGIFDLTRADLAEIDDRWSSDGESWYSKYEEEYGDKSSQYANAMSVEHALTSTLDGMLEFNLTKAVCSGLIEQEDAEKIGHLVEGRSSGDTWQVLPQTLYHVTSDFDSIMRNGIKSRYELSKENAAGLGGGSSETISFTTSRRVVDGIERALHESVLVANGHITFRDLINLSKEGAGGVGRDWSDEFVASVARRIGSQTEMRSFDDYTAPENRDQLPMIPKMLLDFEDGKTVLLPKRFMHSEQEVWTKEKYMETLWDSFRQSYLSVRESLGGYYDPLFFGTSWKAIKTIDPKKIGVLVYKPKTSKTKGVPKSAMDEWRIVGGDNVSVVKTERNFSPDDLESILR